MPRHISTKAIATGVGKAAASAHKIKPGKMNIWDPSVEFSMDSCSSASDAASMPFSTSSSCAVEYERMIKTKLIRKQLRKLRLLHRGDESSSKIRPAVMAIERWFMRYQLGKSKDREKKCGSRGWCDPVIPMLENRDDIVIDQGLVDDIVSALETPEVATKVARDLAVFAHDAALEIGKMAAELSGTMIGDRETDSEKVVLEHHRHTIDVLLDDRSRSKLFKINPVHYDKLKSMYCRRLAALQSSEEKADEELDEQLFHCRLFCLLARYHSIQGHGFQAAVPEQAFEVLHRRFGVVFECFASPLNSRFATHASAFADTDSYFGSVGSFFQFSARQGSFEANPPFEPTLMLAMATHIDSLLNHANGPLSFVVIVPGWKECKAWTSLSKSRWNRACELIAKDDHGFCDGAAHQRRDRYRESPYDTAMFFLQNKSGAKKWPVTAKSVQELREAFAEGRPSAAMRLRQSKAGRGTADESRGVYKGKKRNATGEGVVARKKNEEIHKKKKRKLARKQRQQQKKSKQTA